MKKRNMFRFLPLGVVLCLLALAVLPSTTLAAETSIRVFPYEVTEGGSVDVRGEGFGNDHPSVAERAGFVFVTVYLSPEVADLGDRVGVDVNTYAAVDDSSRVDEFGRWEATFRVPSSLVGSVQDGVGADADVDVDVEEGPYYVYVTYWNDDVIVAESMIQVKEVVRDRFPFRRGFSRFSPPWYRLCEYTDECSCPDDGSSWDCWRDQFLWVPPDDWCGDWQYDWTDDCCDECSDDWDDDCPLPWPPRPYCWSVIPIPPCDC